MNTLEYLERLIEQFSIKSELTLEEKEELLSVIPKMLLLKEEEIKEDNIINLIINK